MVLIRKYIWLDFKTTNQNIRISKSSGIRYFQIKPLFATCYIISLQNNYIKKKKMLQSHSWCNTNNSLLRSADIIPSMWLLTTAINLNSLVFLHQMMALLVSSKKLHINTANSIL